VSCLIAPLVQLWLSLGSAAAACPAAVSLSGDAALVSEVRSVLAGRGVVTEPGGCPALAVTLERRGGVTVVARPALDEPAAAREVTDLRTAATVIESWVRTDVEAPLLARRADDGEMPEGLAVIAKTAPGNERPAFELFTLGELSVASDHTSSFGFQAGACGRVGRACLGGRARFTNFEAGPGAWASLDRETIDALTDLAVPLRLGPLTAAPGVAAGVGWTHTHDESGPDHRQALGLRAEAHLALSYPLNRAVAAESELALTLARTFQADDTGVRLPGDPTWLAHLALGLRFVGP
jgi:hypothetical protein